MRARTVLGFATASVLLGCGGKEVSAGNDGKSVGSGGTAGSVSTVDGAVAADVTVAPVPSGPCAGKTCGDMCSTCEAGQACGHAVEWCTSSGECTKAAPLCSSAIALALCDGTEPKTSVVITSAYMSGATLVADLELAGGCVAQQIHACWDGTYYDTLPGQVDVLVWATPVANPCSAIVQTTATIDLSSVNAGQIVNVSPIAPGDGGARIWALDYFAAAAPALAKRTFFMAVEQACDKASVGLPSRNPLPDASYAAVSGAAGYTIAFSSDATTVTVTPPVRPAMTGHLTKLSAPPAYDLRLGYELDWVAGGMLWIWYAPGAMHADVTIFGSGVPIISCDRGSLEP
jgi:hypothetical protein